MLNYCSIDSFKIQKAQSTQLIYFITVQRTRDNSHIFTISFEVNQYKAETTVM